MWHCSVRGVKRLIRRREEIYPLCRTTTLEAAGPDVGRMAVAAWNVDSSTVTPVRGADTAGTVPVGTRDRRGRRA